MDTHHIHRGRDIKLRGAAVREIVNLPLPKKVAVQPSDFKGLKLRPAVRQDDLVKVGTPLLTDKIHPEVKILSPVSGKVTAINRGKKRVLLEIVVEPDRYFIPHRSEIARAVWYFLNGFTKIIRNFDLFWYINELKAGLIFLIILFQ